MSGHNSTENISASRSDVTPNAVSSTTTHTRQRIVQNFLLVWMDAKINQSNTDCQNALAQLRNVVNDIHLFTEPDQCVDFLTDIKDTNAFLIADGSLGQHIIPHMHDIPQLDAIYIFCANKSRHEQWTKKWAKIKGVHTDPRTKNPTVGSHRILQENLDDPTNSDRNPTTSDRILSEVAGFLGIGIRQEVVGCRIRQSENVGNCRIRRDPIGIL
jgi:hypothetical protein